MSKPSQPQSFLSYAHDDLKTVRELYADLKARGVRLWFDKEHLAPGRWKTQIQKAIPKSRYFIFCISKATLQKTEDGSGFVDEELQQAYEIAMAQDEQHFTIIPVRLEETDTRGDNRLSIFQQYDLFIDWKNEVDRLAVYLGGVSLASLIEKEEQSEEEKLIDGLNSKAASAYYAQEFDRALQFVGTIISLNPEYASAWYNKGVILGSLGRSEEEFQAYEEALRINPDDADAWYGKGFALGNLGRSEEALQAYEEALRIKPDYADAWYNKGIALRSLGRSEEELQAFEKARELEL